MRAPLLLSTMIALAPALLAAQDRPPRADTTRAEEAVSFDFQGTDISAVITTMAEAGGLNVTFSSLPQRPITLRTSQPIARSAVRGLLRTIIESNGLELTEQDGVLRVVAPQPRPAPPPVVQAPPPAASRAPQTQDSIRLYVYSLKHAQAPRLAATVQALFGISYGLGYTGGLSRGSLSDELRGQRIPSGYPQSGGIQQADPLGQRQPGQVAGSLQIVADELSNRLLIRARPGDWPIVQEAIQALDIRPLQVLIEALIVEVRSTNLFDLGLAVDVPEQIEPKSGIRIDGQLGSASAGDLVLKVMNLGGISADVVVSAISSKANVRVVSRPVVLAQNNIEARILIGSQRPFIQVSRALPTDDAVRDQVVQYRDVGTSLTLLPTISDDGFVTVQLLQEVSTATSETQFGAPVISTREASTQLLVRDGQTAVIGGLIDQQSDRARSGVPLLKNLPLLGWLFGSTKKFDVRTELFLFLTPHVIRTDDDAERLRERLEEAGKLLRKNLPPGSIVPDTTARR